MTAQVCRNTEATTEFWTTSEFCKVINVSPTTLKKLLKAGQIKGAYQFGKQWRIHKVSFYESLKLSN